MANEHEIIVSTVNQGKLEPWKGKALVSAISHYEGKIVMIQVMPFYKVITGKQLRFVNGVFLPALHKIYTDLGNTIDPEVLRENFKKQFGPKQAVCHPDGSITMEPKSMKIWSREEASDACENARSHYAPFGELPFPTSAIEGEDNATTT